MIYILPIILSMCHLGLMGSDNVRLEDFQEICANTNTSIDKNLTTISFLADCHLTQSLIFHPLLTYPNTELFVEGGNFSLLGIGYFFIIESPVNILIRDLFISTSYFRITSLGGLSLMDCTFTKRGTYKGDDANRYLPDIPEDVRSKFEARAINTPGLDVPQILKDEAAKDPMVQKASKIIPKLLPTNIYLQSIKHLSLTNVVLSGLAPNQNITSLNLTHYTLKDSYIIENFTLVQNLIYLISRDQPLYVKNITIIGCASYFNGNTTIRDTSMLNVFASVSKIKGLIMTDCFILRAIFLDYANNGDHSLEDIHIDSNQWQLSSLMVIRPDYDQQFNRGKRGTDKVTINGLSIVSNYIEPGTPFMELLSYRINRMYPWIQVNDYDTISIKNLHIWSNEFALSDQIIFFLSEKIRMFILTNSSFRNNTVSVLVADIFLLINVNSILIQDLEIDRENNRDVQSIYDNLKMLTQAITVMTTIFAKFDMFPNYDQSIEQFYKRYMPIDFFNIQQVNEFQLSNVKIQTKFIINIITILNTETPVGIVVNQIIYDLLPSEVQPCVFESFQGFFLSLAGPATKINITDSKFKNINLISAPFISLQVQGQKSQIFQGGKISLKNLTFINVTLVINDISAVSTLFKMSVDPIFSLVAQKLQFVNILLLSVPLQSGIFFCSKDQDNKTFSYDPVSLSSPLFLIESPEMNVILNYVDSRNITAKLNFGGFAIKAKAIEVVNCTFLMYNTHKLRNDTDLSLLGGLFASQAKSLLMRQCIVKNITFSYAAFLITSCNITQLKNLIVADVSFFKLQHDIQSGGLILLFKVAIFELLNSNIKGISQGFDLAMIQFINYDIDRTNITIQKLNLQIETIVHKCKDMLNTYLLSNEGSHGVQGKQIGIISLDEIIIEGNDNEVCYLINIFFYSIKIKRMVIANIKVNNQLIQSTNSRQSIVEIYILQVLFSQIISTSAVDTSLLVMHNSALISIKKLNVNHIRSFSPKQSVLTLFKVDQIIIEDTNMMNLNNSLFAYFIESTQIKIFKVLQHRSVAYIEIMSIFIDSAQSIGIMNSIFSNLSCVQKVDRLIPQALIVRNSSLSLKNNKFNYLQGGQLVFINTNRQNNSNGIVLSITFQEPCLQCVSINLLNIVLFKGVLPNDYKYVPSIGFYPNILKVSQKSILQTDSISYVRFAAEILQIKLVLQPGMMLQLELEFYYDDSKYYLEVYRDIILYAYDKKFSFSRDKMFTYSHQAIQFIEPNQGDWTTFKIKIANVNVNSTGCQLGYIWEKNKTLCSPCESTTFSFEALTCMPCLPHAKCQKGMIVKLDDGYWRKDNASTQLIECDTKVANCLGHNDATTLGFKCAKGKLGPLCQTCDFYGEKHNGHKYFRLDQLKCGLCSKVKLNLVKFCVVGAFSLMCLFLSLYLTLDGIRQSIECTYLRRMGILIVGLTGQVFMTGSYIKMIITHFQILSVLKAFRYQNTQELGWIIDSTQIVGTGFTESTYSFDCLVIDTFEGRYQVQEVILVMQIFLPIFILTVQTLAIVLIRQASHQQIRIYQLSFYALFVYYFMLPTVSESLISFSSCSSIGDTYYLKSNVLQECYKGSHFQFFISIVLPFELLYIVLFPLLIFIRLKFKVADLGKISMLMSMGNFYLDYKSTVYYFEMYRFMQKIMVTLLSNGLDYNHTFLSQGMILLLMFVQQITQRLQPYGYNELVVLDARSSFTLSFSILISYLSEANQNVWLQWLMLLIVSGLNLFFFFTVIRSLIRIAMLQYDDFIFAFLKRIGVSKKNYSRAFLIRKHWRKIYNYLSSARALRLVLQQEQGRGFKSNISQQPSIQAPIGDATVVERLQSQLDANLEISVSLIDPQHVFLYTDVSNQ